MEFASADEAAIILQNFWPKIASDIDNIQSVKRVFKFVFIFLF